MRLLQKIDHLEQQGVLSATIAPILKEFYLTYLQAAQQNGYPPSFALALHERYLSLTLRQLQSPFSFSSYHQRITYPYNYYRFGLQFMRPIIRLEESTIQGKANLDKVAQQVTQGDNVIFFANHQIEPDPQVISLMIEASYPKLAEEIIWIAGHRVTTDPLATPFSMGRNLLCIYSKKYIEDPPALKAEKLAHNQKTMKQMAQLLAEGGKCIFVAPSGGRDRPDETGQVRVAPFDAQSIAMFWLMAQQTPRPTHFYPVALSTYHLMPPPASIGKELTEKRQTYASAVHLSFGEEIAMDGFSRGMDIDKKELRRIRAEAIWQTVKEMYDQLGRPACNG